MARLIGIAVRPAGTREIRELERAAIDMETGLAGDKRSRPGRRQVTLMSLAAWQQACAELGESLPWTTRRANLLVDELPLYRTAGGRIHIGEVVLEITGETDPCNKMEAARAGLFEALRPQWRGGVTGWVLRGGELVVGRDVELVTA
jgi:MOSC domain-containing protein YiiM